MAEQVAKGLRHIGTAAQMPANPKHGFGRSNSIKRPRAGSVQDTTTKQPSGQKIRHR